MTSLSDFTATAIDGTPKQLADYAGEVVLVVNTASQCGFTSQYGPLQQLQTDYADRGFVVLGFPCDQFGHQEPGTEAEIAQFCETSYAVSFPMFAKIDVNGEHAHPLYRWLKSERSGILGGAIKWNFTKFLIDRGGAVVKRYAPTVDPADIRPDIERLLAA
ncbi:glutathione peroxidase [Naumannella halotolerans]|uniref:Glutathione peroxidase n=1 Tax=Naumannella halotolerans TaxID=993414 RepID=A0A4R7J7B2_9ACTN|nr:glutathione peroxidase [Naumannella halotolerans]TDT33321.1 glutathione peroxidase [Naumannella halotolerans]